MLLAPAQSAPHLLISDCYDEPLGDSESVFLKKSASTNVLYDLDLSPEEHEKIVENLVELREEIMSSIKR
jgi:hypothetical protein